MEDRKQLNDRLPELRPSGALTKGERLAPKVFGSDDVQPQAALTVGNPPKPMGQESNIQAPRGQDPKTPLVFGFADV